MPRTRKPRPNPTPEESGLGGAANGTTADEEGDAPRPSQLDQIRAAMAEPYASKKEIPELVAPEEPRELAAPESEPAPELESHVEEPPAAASEPAEEAAPVAAAVAEPATSPWVPPPTQPPTGMRPTASAAGSGRSNPGLALGIVLVVVGFFFLVMRIFDIDLSSYGWPLFVIKIGRASCRE